MKHVSSISLAAGLLTLLGSSAASAVAVPGQGTWETTLQARDIDHDGFVDAFYDTATNLTWLSDGNAIKTSGYAAPSGFTQPDTLGRVTYQTAYEWAHTLNLAGVTGWRLPTLQDEMGWVPAGSHAFWGAKVVSGTSELENLFLAGVINSGLMRNVQSDGYWTETPNIQFPNARWAYIVGPGQHERYFIDDTSPVSIYALAVHTGDIGATAAVPEPSTYALLMCGLAVTYVARRRTAKQPG